MTSSPTASEQPENSSGRSVRVHRGRRPAVTFLAAEVADSPGRACQASAPCLSCMSCAPVVQQRPRIGHNWLSPEVTDQTVDQRFRVSALVRGSAGSTCQGEGRGFESRRPLPQGTPVRGERGPGRSPFVLGAEPPGPHGASSLRPAAGHLGWGPAQHAPSWCNCCGATFSLCFHFV